MARYTFLTLTVDKIMYLRFGWILNDHFIAHLSVWLSVTFWTTRFIISYDIILLYSLLIYRQTWAIFHLLILAAIAVIAARSLRPGRCVIFRRSLNNFVLIYARSRITYLVSRCPWRHTYPEWHPGPISGAYRIAIAISWVQKRRWRGIALYRVRLVPIDHVITNEAIDVWRAECATTGSVDRYSTCDVIIIIQA